MKVIKQLALGLVAAAVLLPASPARAAAPSATAVLTIKGTATRTMTSVVTVSGTSYAFVQWQFLPQQNSNVSPSKSAQATTSRTQATVTSSLTVSCPRDAVPYEVNVQVHTRSWSLILAQTDTVNPCA
jgi:hypothetical protein